MTAQNLPKKPRYLDLPHLEKPKINSFAPQQQQTMVSEDSSFITGTARIAGS